MQFKCDFRPGMWDKDFFQIVKSPRWQVNSQWIQESDGISNQMPLPPDDDEGKMYVSMLCKQPLRTDIRIETECSFDERMAPLIVLSRELLPEHREHLEIVLYDRGINLWHHFYDNGKPSWKLIAFQDHPLAAGEKHRLVAEVRNSPRGRFLYIGIDEPSFGCRMPENWPETFYAGITACEGKNKFYSFTLSGVTDDAVKCERFRKKQPLNCAVKR